MRSLSRLRNSRLDVSWRCRYPSTKAKNITQKVFRIQKSVKAFRIDQIVLWTYVKQKKVVNFLLNDHIQGRDEFCGEHRSISVRLRVSTVAVSAGTRNHFSFYRIYGLTLSPGEKWYRSPSSLADQHYFDAPRRWWARRPLASRVKC